MKKISLLLLFFLALTTKAQNFETKIPDDVQFVMSFSGAELQKNVSLSELNNYDFVKKIFKKTGKISKLEDLGINMDKDIYIYYTQKEKQYICFLIPLTDSNKFAKLLNSDMQIDKVGNVNLFVKSKGVVSWNTNTAFIALEKENNKQFSSEPIIIKENDKESEEIILSEDAEEDEDDVVKTAKKSYKIEPNDDIEKKEKINKALKELAINFFNSTPDKSILTNLSYQKGKEKKSIGYFWTGDYSKLMVNLFKQKNNNMYNFFIKPEQLQQFYGIKSMVSNLFVEEDGFLTKYDFEFLENKAEQYKKMYDSKIDRAFFNYFDQDKALAYISLSSNMEKVLKELPNIYNEILGVSLPMYKQEIDLGTDYISLLLDEKAIGELITGDILLIFNDMGEKEVKYTSYKYDDNWKRIEEVKTKKEFVPDFTFMIGSENKSFITKLLNLGIKYKLVKNNNSFYELVIPKSKMPFNLFITQKDDIIFLSTSKNIVENVVNDTFKRNVGKHKRLMRKNMMTFYVNSAKIISKIPKNTIPKSKTSIIKYTEDNIKEIMMTSSKIKGNHMKSEIKLTTDNKEGNGIKVFLKLIDMISKS